MEVQTLRGQGVGELLKQARTLKDELFQARFKHATQQLTEVKRIKEIRRDIARLKMVAAEKLANKTVTSKAVSKAPAKAAAKKAPAAKKAASKKEGK